MNNPDIYICDCGREANVPANSGLPNGWTKLPASSVIQCPVCADFEEIVTAYEEGRTHDSTSAINDEPVAIRPLPVRNSQQWLVTLTFATDKGKVETNWPTTAANAHDALQRVKIGFGLIKDLVGIAVTPAPLEAQSAAIAPSFKVTVDERIAA